MAPASVPLPRDSCTTSRFSCVYGHPVAEVGAHARALPDAALEQTALAPKENIAVDATKAAVRSDTPSLFFAKS